MDSTRKLGIIGAPIEWGSHTSGCAIGPATLRYSGLAASLQDLGYDVIDHGDFHAFAEDSAGENAEASHWPQQAKSSIPGLGNKIKAMIRDHQVPIILGGDHALSFASVPALAECSRDRGADLFVLWLDAHADFNTPKTSPSMNFHGMSVAYFCGFPDFDALPEGGPNVFVNPEHVTLLGIRSIDHAERERLTRSGIQVNDMRLIDEIGITAIIKPFLDRVKKSGGDLHVSMDIDFLDPEIAPAVGTTVPGGATFREAHLIMELLHDSGLVTSIEIAELNPLLDIQGKTARLVVDLVTSLFGKQVFDHLAFRTPL